jgi:phosphosulfolactate synthase (CoM biosynthesis protein A)
MNYVFILNMRVPKKPSGRKRSPFYWWRRFRTHKTKPWNASLLAKIKEELEEYKKNYVGFDDPERSTGYMDIKKKAHKRYSLLYKDGHETDNKRLQDLVEGFCKEFKITKFEVWEIMETFGGTIEELYRYVADKFEYNKLSKKKAIEIFKLNNI